MGQRLTTMTAKQKLAIQPTEFTFSRHGQSGVWLSELLPGIGAVADEICFIKSMHTEAINHSPGMTLFMTGSQIPGRPSMGAWLNYGLGSVSQELPGYVVMMSRDQHGTCGQLLFDYYYGSGFLPSRLQGVKFRTVGEPVLYLSNPKGVSREVRRGLLDDLAKLNEMKRTPRTASLPAAWPSAACASSSCSTSAGTRTGVCRSNCGCSATTPTWPPGR